MTALRSCAQLEPRKGRALPSEAASLRESVLQQQSLIAEEFTSRRVGNDATTTHDDAPREGCSRELEIVCADDQRLLQRVEQLDQFPTTARVQSR